MQLTAAHLRYLLAIYEVSRTHLDISSRSIAEKLGVTKPSVVRILNLLMEQGMIVKEYYGKIYLTDRGIWVAKRVQQELDAKSAELGVTFNYADYTFNGQGDSTTLNQIAALAAVLVRGTGKSDRSQTSTVGKCSRSNGGNCFRNSQAGQPAAKIECHFADVL